MNSKGQADQLQAPQTETFRHRLVPLYGVIVLVVTVVFLLSTEFLAPYDIYESRFDRRIPPQRLHFLDPSRTGKQLRLHVYAYQQHRDPVTLRNVYTRDLEQKLYLDFLVRGNEYRLPFGFESDLHLWGIVDPEQRVYLLGGDRLGRDILSRMLFAIRHSLLLGVGVLTFCGGIGWCIAVWVQRSYMEEIRVFQRAKQVMPMVPTWPLRIILLMLIARQWPFLDVFVHMAITQRTPVPEIRPDLVGPVWLSVKMGLVVSLASGCR